MKRMILRWSGRKIILPIRKALKNGISVERLSVSLALGITVGLIPLYGFTTLIVGCIALSLRLDFISMQVAHYIVSPIQIALLVPFFKLGDLFIRSSEFSLTIQQYLHYFKTDFWGTLREFWLLNLTAIGIWLIVALPLFFVLYYLLTRTIRKYHPYRLHKTV